MSAPLPPEQEPRARLRAALLGPDFVSATFSGCRPGAALRWQRLTMRPVRLKDGPHLQFSYYDERQNIIKNYAPPALAAMLDEALALPFRHITVHTQAERLQLSYSKKDRPHFSRQPLAQPVTAALDLAHDRAPRKAIAEGVPLPFLLATGMTTPDGRVKTDMRSKFRQMNEFLRLLTETDDLPRRELLEVVDFGCGSAHLTFATHYYLNEVLGRPAHVTGVDLKAHLIDRHRATAQALGWPTLDFVTASIADYVPPQPPAVVIALHACDTATDDAIAQGVRWRSPLIVCAPCCHHHLQAQMQAQPAPLAPLLRYGLFQERLGDMLTDTFRAQLLRLHGYRVDVVQLVPAEHTPKNVLLRAVRVADHGDDEQQRDYAALRDYWQVTPRLEELIGTG
ncbi:MAG: SAM-dependent methyltransferase [Anaerolineae bacterium]|nr:SAM-dependent methyltransferase [Anaerolineae bacterium]